MNELVVPNNILLLYIESAEACKRSAPLAFIPPTAEVSIAIFGPPVYKSNGAAPPNVNDPDIWALPVILVVPINVWVSVVSSPKILDPEVWILDDVMKDDVKCITFKLSTDNWFVVELYSNPESVVRIPFDPIKGTLFVVNVGNVNPAPIKFPLALILPDAVMWESVWI